VRACASALCALCLVSWCMRVPSVMCGEFARAWPMHGLSIGCLFVPYLISCRLRTRECPLFVDFVPLSRAVSVLAKAV